MAVAYQAGASGLPFGLMRHYAPTDLDRAAAAPAAELRCPFTGALLLAVPALNPDVTVLHAQAVDAAGNVLIRGIVGAAREAALAARTLLVTVEAQVDRFEADLNAIVLPHWMISAVSVVPGGAHPSYAAGCYERDNRFYVAWDDIAREREAFTRWLDEYVYGSSDHAQLLERLGVVA